MWRGWVATGRAAEYVAYVERTGLVAYRRTPGNIDAQMWTRDLGDGRTEVVTVSRWEPRAAHPGGPGDEHLDLARVAALDGDPAAPRQVASSGRNSAPSARRSGSVSSVIGRGPAAMITGSGSRSSGSTAARSAPSPT